MSEQENKVVLERNPIKAADEIQTPDIDINSSTIDKRDMGDRVVFNNGTNDEISNHFKATTKEEKEAIQNQLKDSESYLYKLLSSASNHNSQSILLSKALKQLHEDQKELTVAINGITDKITRGKKVGGKLSGADAKLNVIARTKGLMKLNLWNSLFHVVIRPFNLSELNEFFNTVDLENKEFGKILGGHFHMISDVFLKQKFMELFQSCVVSSNLKGWEKIGTLAKAIKFQDYDVLLWGACSLLFREGINIELVCVNPECKHVESKLYIDLNNAKLNNFDIVPPEVIEIMTLGEEVNLQTLRQNQNLLNLNKTVVDNTDPNNIAHYQLQVPSIADYLNNGLRLTAKMISAVNGEASIEDNKMQTQILIYLYQTLVPWITQIDFINENKEVDFSVADLDAIIAALDNSNKDTTFLYRQIEDFIKTSKISFICYSGVKCPKCGKEPESSVNDFFPIDVQLLFFYLCCRQLELIGVNLIHT